MSPQEAGAYWTRTSRIYCRWKKSMEKNPIAPTGTGKKPEANQPAKLSAEEQEKVWEGS